MLLPYLFDVNGRYKCRHETCSQSIHSYEHKASLSRHERKIQHKCNDTCLVCQRNKLPYNQKQVQPTTTATTHISDSNNNNSINYIVNPPNESSSPPKPNSTFQKSTIIYRNPQQNNNIIPQLSNEHPIVNNNNNNNNTISNSQMNPVERKDENRVDINFILNPPTPIDTIENPENLSNPWKYNH